MACNKCNPCSQTTPCVESHDCECPVFTTTDCSTLSEDLECSGILKGQTETEVLKQLDAYICERFNSVENFFKLINVGTGAQVYKGISILGEKELRTLVDSSLINIVQGTNDITISVDETALNTFIEANQKTYSASNLGTGASVYKDSTITGDNTQFNLRKINTVNSGNGVEILKPQVENIADISIIAKSLTSTTLNIDFTDSEISINTPSSASIPALYVNNLYIPTYDDFLSGITKGLGTIAKPFTDTINYTTPSTYTITPDTAIQNALDSYVGTGSRLAPEKVGQDIIIQDNTSSYDFSGDYNYSRLSIRQLGTVNYLTSGYLVNMDNLTYFQPSLDSVNIHIEEGKFFNISGLGFLNSGSNVATSTGMFTNYIKTSGKGNVQGISTDNNKYLFSADPLGTANGGLGVNNDGEQCFFIQSGVIAEAQGICITGGLSRISLNGADVRSGGNTPISIGIKAFNQNGGSITILNSNINMAGVTRNVGFTFTPSGLFTPILTCSNSVFSGVCDVWFNKTNSSDVIFSLINSSSFYFGGGQLFNSPNLWEINFRNNIFESTSIDFTKVDLTQGNSISSINTIGGSIIETLVKYPSKEAASFSIAKGSAFLNRKTVTAGAFIIGAEYQILTIGTTNFTAIGAVSNTVGIYFTATGTGTGTGTAYFDIRDLIV